MSATALVFALAVWLALQIPIGVAIGRAIRRAQSSGLVKARTTARHRHAPARSFANARPSALLHG
jgi:hypothetical protein